MCEVEYERSILNDAVVFVAMELSKSTWLLAAQGSPSGKSSSHRVESGDIPGLLALLRRLQARERQTCGGGDVQIVVGYEAGYDGFWLQRRLAAGVLSAGHARSLLAVDDDELQDRLAQRVVAEGISVRALEELVAVGEPGSQPTRQVRRKPVAPGLTELADRLSDRLETRVKVDLGRSKGKITVEFASMEDLQRIVDVMDPRNRDDRPI